MGNKPTNILIVENNSDHQELMKKALSESGRDYKADTVNTGKECMEKIYRKDYDCILLDYKLRKTNGLDVLDKINAEKINVPVIVITGHGNEKIAVETMKKGAYDYITKTGDYLSILSHTVQNACEWHKQNNEQKRLTRELIQSEKRCHEVIENSPDIIHSVNAEGYIMDTNNAAVKCLGYSRKELTGMQIDELYAPDLLEEVHKGFEKLKKEGVLSGVQSAIISKDGIRIEVEISSTAHYDEKGDFVETYSILRDITNYKKMEAELREKITELEKFTDVAVGRELKMAQMDKEIERLKRRIGE